MQVKPSLVGGESKLGCNSEQIENNCEDTRPVLWVVVVGEKYAPIKATLFDVNMALARRDAGVSTKYIDADTGNKPHWRNKYEHISQFICHAQGYRR